MTKVSAVFAENFPISDSRENFVLEFVDYTIDPPKYNVDECIDRGLTFSVPLKAKLRLLCNDEDNEDFNTIEQDGLLKGVTRSLFSGGYNVTLNQIGDALANGELENAATSPVSNSSTRSVENRCL